MDAYEHPTKNRKNEKNEKPRNMEVESENVIHLVLQFLKENNLLKSARALEEESNLVFNSMENPKKLEVAVKNGLWNGASHTKMTFSFFKRLKSTKINQNSPSNRVIFIELNVIEFAQLFTKLFLTFTFFLFSKRRSSKNYQNVLSIKESHDRFV